MENITYNSYWAEVKDLATMLLDENDNCMETISDNSLDHEAVDGHQWIIYTTYHDQILNFSDNTEAYLDLYGNDDLGQIVSEHGLDHARMIQAFWAFLYDVQNSLHDQFEEREAI
jgi:hypothetical protein